MAELGAERATRPQFKVAVGDPATVIQETAEESEKPTQVAVGSRGLDAVRRFALGSVSTHTSVRDESLYKQPHRTRLASRLDQEARLSTRW